MVGEVSRDEWVVVGGISGVGEGRVDDDYLIAWRGNEKREIRRERYEVSEGSIVVLVRECRIAVVQDEAEVMDKQV